MVKDLSKSSGKPFMAVAGEPVPNSLKQLDEFMKEDYHGLIILKHEGTAHDHVSLSLPNRDGFWDLDDFEELCRRFVRYRNKARKEKRNAESKEGA